MFKDIYDFFSLGLSKTNIHRKSRIPFLFLGKTSFLKIKNHKANLYLPFFKLNEVR